MTQQEFSDSLIPIKQPKRSASAAGFHFLNLFQCCPRKFFIRFVLRLDPKYTATPLIFGSAFHEAKATFYQTKSLEEALAVGKSIIQSSKKELYEPSEIPSLQNRLELMFESWVDQYGKIDLKRFKFLCIEKEFVVPVANTGLVMTMRPDTIVQEKQTGLIYIMETKTSSFSIRVTADAVLTGDQATSYLWGVHAATGWNIYGLQPDITYWSKNSASRSGIQNDRPSAVLRDQQACLRFELGVAQLIAEITAKVNAYKHSTDPWQLFPRNSHYCCAFSHPCEYSRICFDQLHETKQLPDGFKRIKSRRDILSNVFDSIDIL